MKNKYGLWKRCFHSLIGIVILTGSAGLVGCTQLKSDFSYSPTEPRAGQLVTFANHSTGADDYRWTFGDNSSSDATSPSHVYCKPGIYTVSLRIMRNKVETRTHTCQVTILDTIPAIQMDTDSIYTFTPITLKAEVYNPWKRTLTYRWTLPKEAVVLNGTSMDSSAIVCYFTQTMDAANIQLDLHIGDQQHILTRQEAVYHQPSQSLLYHSDKTIYEQYIYFVRNQRRYQAAEVTTTKENIAIINNEQDSLFIYGDTTLTIASVGRMIGKTIDGFQVDKLMAKVYAYNNNGLYVCNINGSHIRTLTDQQISAIKVDGVSNRLYWATKDGLFSHRLMQMKDNGEDFVPEQVNACSSITRISVHTDRH